MKRAALGFYRKLLTVWDVGFLLGGVLMLWASAQLSGGPRALVLCMAPVCLLVAALMTASSLRAYGRFVQELDALGAAEQAELEAEWQDGLRLSSFALLGQKHLIDYYHGVLPIAQIERAWYPMESSLCVMYQGKRRFISMDKAKGQNTEVLRRLRNANPDIRLERP